MNKLLIAAALTLLCAPALAQSEFPTPNIGQNSVGVVSMCINASGKAVPATAAGQCAFTPSPTLGTTTGGWKTVRLSGLTTTVTSIKTTGGQLAKLHCFNPNTAVAYVQVFNAVVGSVVLGTTTPAQSYGIAPSTSGGFSVSVVGDQYATAISVAATTTAAGNTAPTVAIDCNASFN